MENDSIKKDIVSAFWVIALVISLILNFNFIGALIVKDYNWIMDNWLCDIGIILLPAYYIAVHYVLIFGYKTAITRLK